MPLPRGLRPPEARGYTARGYMGVVRRSVCSFWAVAAALLLAAPASAAGPDPVGPPSQSLADGCQRNVPGFLAQTSPEWAYVHSYDSQYVSPDNTHLAEGVVHHSHPAEDDLPMGHTSFDLNFNVSVDPAYTDLVGGDPAKQTGNYGPGDEQGALHTEWEETAIPRWAWPTENDRVKMWGSWIWDCGHWGLGFPDYFVPSQIPYTGPVTGERTEFHSFKFVAVSRAKASTTATAETQTDVFGSTDGRKAHAQEQCAHDYPAPSGATDYGPEYTACVQDPAKQRQTLNDRNYDFFVPAPPKPSASAVLTWRAVNHAGATPTETVTPAANGINVTVNYQGSPAQSYGKTFYVGWSAGAKKADHLQMTVNSVKVNRSLDPNPDRQTQSGTPPGEYNLYMDVNGIWRYLNDSAPALLTVTDGQTVPVNQISDVYVQPGQAVRVVFTGRECDFVGVQPCPQTSELSDQNDRPGDALQTFSSAKAALGTHTVQSDMATPSQSDPTRVTNYVITYTVRKL
jgi:hypothetical protein